MKTKFKTFKKNQIHDLNKVIGGGITYKTNDGGGTSSDYYTIHYDAWFLFEKNNSTSEGHTDNYIGDKPL